MFRIHTLYFLALFTQWWWATLTASRLNCISNTSIQIIQLTKMFWKWIWCIVTNMVLFFSFFLKPFSIHPKIHQKINKIRTFTKFDSPKNNKLKNCGTSGSQTTALNTIPEKGRSFLAPSGPPPTRPKSTMNLSHRETVKLRERTTPRKPRPASVAGSTPAFSPNVKKSADSRSKSTDRLPRPRGRVTQFIVD